jgi:hypothetical protein
MCGEYSEVRSFCHPLHAQVRSFYDRPSDFLGIFTLALARPVQKATAMSTDTTPQFIPGIYNWCDRWCERCRFRTRCLTAAMHADIEQAAARGEEFSTADWLDRNLEPYNGPPRPWLDEILEAANRPLSEEQQREIDRQEAERERRLKADALVLDAKEYGDIAAKVARVLVAQLKEQGDSVVLAALDAIEHQALCIGSKTYRACSGGILDAMADIELDDEEEQQSDYNGSAKIARLMIAESRECWAVLMQIGRAMADGVPLKMVGRLDRLDRDLAARFPRAMSFTRPGFDE